MDEALRSMSRMFAAFDEAMTTEQVPPATRRRVLNQLMFGNPDGDVNATIELPDPTAVHI